MKKIFIGVVVGISLISSAYAVPVAKGFSYSKDKLDKPEAIQNQQSHWVTAKPDAKPYDYTPPKHWNLHPAPPSNVPSNKEMLPPGMLKKDPQDYNRLLNLPTLARPPKHPSNLTAPKIPSPKK